jgi:hypothetical protein
MIVPAPILVQAPCASSDQMLVGPASRFVHEKWETLLAAEVEELASLRFSIVLTAKWESSCDGDPEQRQELRVELKNLRTRYYDKIDQIAMGFGVAQAMIAKDEVENRITRPLCRKAISAAEEAGAFEI